jgi:hypothetical protein
MNIPGYLTGAQTIEQHHHRTASSDPMKKARRFAAGLLV